MRGVAGADGHLSCLDDWGQEGKLFTGRNRDPGGPGGLTRIGGVSPGGWGGVEAEGQGMIWNHKQLKGPGSELASRATGTFSRGRQAANQAVVDRVCLGFGARMEPGNTIGLISLHARGGVEARNGTRPPTWTCPAGPEQGGVEIQTL